MTRISFLNPRSDRAFAALVEELMAEGAGNPEELQARLRSAYPDALVRERGLAGELDPVWYVYRDGRWVPDDREGS